MARSHPLKRLAREQKRDLHRLVSQTEASVHTTFIGAKYAAKRTISSFAQAYEAELARLNADAEAEEKHLVPLHWLLSSGWGQRVIAPLGSAANQAGQYSLAHVAQAHGSAAYLGNAHARDLLNLAMEPAVKAGMSYAPRSAFHAIDTRIIGRAGNGGPLGALFDGFGAEASHKAQGVLYAALSTGTNPRAIAGQLTDVLDISRNRALVIARTELIDAYRNAQHENYRANSDVVQQWMWSAASDACIACIEMDGQVFEVETDIDGHPNCRCSPIPVTKSWDDILSPLGIDASDIPDTRITNGYQTGADWFNEQDAETQQTTLGPAAYAAWKAGDVELSDFVGFTDGSDGWGKSLYQKSLKQMGLDAGDYLD